ncbi:DUF2490 domain-containing protein [Flavobacterium sangjuense]|uniref:DUF2490 domain-containing protein n=1 Tax=Flavobacterium sangjuense TaxID=2518177 RepID=A0A4P7PPV9_9FLAO|nr:DUF2490 domain-containing protein [Flavobacterium sangjuense]QBZ96701.1 hypothetical protein GS03_00179 [Flavobacterium sangjuense]
MKKLGIVLLLLIYSNCLAQKTVEDQRVWFAYTGQYKVSEKWGYHIEAQFRLDNELQQNLQNLFRIGGIYYLSPYKNISGGYALVNTYSASLDKFYRENRFWQQYQFNKKWNENKNTIIHRFRLEQRWVEQLATENTTNYQNRFRYLNRNLFHIANIRSSNEEIYAVVQDEVFLNLGDNKINSKVIDQNRFLIGLGLNYNNNIRLELGYMNQFVTSSSGNDVMNHTVSVSLLQNLDLQKH